MAFRELLEDEVTKIKLALYKLYSSARIGESPDQKIDETFDDIMEIFYKSSMDFSFARIASRNPRKDPTGNRLDRITQ